MRTFIMAAIAGITIATSAQAATFSATQNYDPVAVADGSTDTRLVTVTDFGIISDIDIIVNLTGSGNDITPDGDFTGTNPAYFEELALTIISPSGTSVDLITANTYGDGFSARFTLTFDDEATAGLGFTPSTGSYQPVGSLALFNGEEANGSWIFTIEDTTNNDPKSLNSATLNITTSPTAVPLPSAVLLLSGFGLLGRGVARRRNA